MKLSLQKSLERAIEAQKEGAPKTAKQIYSSIIKLHPKNATANFNMGLIYAGLNLIVEALTFFKIAYESEPDNSQFINNYIVALVNLNRLNEADDILKNAKSTGVFGDDFDKLYETVKKLHEKKSSERIIRASRLDAESANFYCNQGAILQNQGDLDGAISKYKQALKINPDIPGAYNNMGNALKNKRNLAEALNCYRQAIKIKPDYAEAYNNMGIALRESGDLDAALNLYKEAIKFKPDFADAYNNMANVLKDNGQIEEAINSYQDAIKFKPDFAEVFINIGNLIRDKGDLDEALSYYKKAIKLKPNYPDAFNNIGNVLKDMGNADGAIEAYNKAIKIQPSYPEVFANKCELFEKSNRLDELAEVIIEAKAILKELPSNLMFYEALHNYRLKRHDECYALINKINTLEIPKRLKAPFWHLKAKACEERSDFNGSFYCFTQMNKVATESSEYSKEHAKIYLDRVSRTVDQLTNTDGKLKTDRSEDLHSNAPTFLIGFPRSGTTLLDTILRSHSQISVLEEKPMMRNVRRNLSNQMTISDIENLTHDEILNLQNIYLEELKQNLPNINKPHIIDKLPLNIVQVPLIHKIFPGSKFIFAQRHPLDSILSCWMQNFQLNSAMSNMVDLAGIVKFYCLAMEVLDLSEKRYSLDIHRIRYEDLVSDMQTEVSNLLNFLNLNWENQIEEYRQTALQRGLIKTPSYSQVIQPLYKSATYRWKNYNEFIEPYFSEVEKWVTKFGYET